MFIRPCTTCNPGAFGRCFNALCLFALELSLVSTTMKNWKCCTCNQKSNILKFFPARGQIIPRSIYKLRLFKVVFQIYQLLPCFIRKLFVFTVFHFSAFSLGYHFPHVRYSMELLFNTGMGCVCRGWSWNKFMLLFKSNLWYSFFILILILNWPWQP